MRRLFAAAALLSLAACDLVKVDRTPRQFYTQRDPARVDQQDDAREIRARLRNFAQEMGRGRPRRALTALNPTDTVLVIGADAGDGVARIGLRGLQMALDSAGIATPAVVRTPDLRVQVGFHENTGWFSEPIEFMRVDTAAPPQWLRATGVFTQDRGEWKLAEIHLSRPYAAPDTTALRMKADSARRDSARRDSARRAAAAPRATPAKTSRRAAAGSRGGG